MSKKTLTLFNHQNGKIPFVPHENCNEGFWRKRGEMGKTVASGETGLSKFFCVFPPNFLLFIKQIVHMFLRSTLSAVCILIAISFVKLKIFGYDRVFMRRAVKLAEKGKGKTHPNPCVGCVVVNDKFQIIGEGYHKKCGQPHAEVNALQNAGGEAHTQNCTAYVTLEPCDHFGRTPPCTLALIRLVM